MFPFKALFRSTSAVRSTREPPVESRPERPDPSSLRSPGRITERLERIRKARCLITISIPGETQTFSSALLRVSSIDRYLLLDELVPRFGNELMDTGLEIRASAYFQGIIHEMETRVEAVGSENNVPIYRLELPERLEFSQRRQHHRVNLPVGVAMPVHCMVGSDRLVRGEMQNISLGGLCFLVDKRQARAIRVGDVIKRCVIEPNGGERIEAALEVRNTSMLTPQANQRRVGARFMDLDSKNLNRVQHLVVALEREELRDHHGRR